ncbi:MAG: hypothetical protein ABFS46_21285, partial [Myxococcota bacterium]
MVRRRRYVERFDELYASTFAGDGLSSAVASEVLDIVMQEDIAGRARERVGAGVEVMMLVPRALDAGLFGGIARALERRGEKAEAYRELRGRYLPPDGGGLRLRIEAAVRRDGSQLPLDLLFDLGEIARVGGDRGGPQT